MRVLDALLFSSLWVAAAAAALGAAVSRVLAGSPAPGPLLLAFGGTLAIYNLDRLRDLPRDRASAPARSVFVDRHYGVLAALGAGGALLGAAGAWLSGPRALAPLALALPLALAHRRLKRFWMAKSLYVSLAWVLVVVGVPAAAAPAGPELAAAALGAAAILGAAIFANAIASNVRDAEAAAAVLGPGRALLVARWVAASSVAAALFAPPAVQPLGLAGVATLAALVGFRPGERYGLAVVDGALLLGGIGACAFAGV